MSEHKTGFIEAAEFNALKAERDQMIENANRHLNDARRLRATLRPCIEIIEANVEFDDEIHQIINEARRALEGK
jgi:hypothetical protein